MISERRTFSAFLTPVAVNGRAIGCEISIEQDLTKDFVLELLLLRFNLARSLVLRDADLAIVVRCQPHQKHRDRERVFIENQQVAVLNGEDLDAIISLYLYAYRDGRAPVNHIDVELGIVECASSDPPEDYTLVFMTRGVEPMPSDDARRLLGLDQEETGTS